MAALPFAAATSAVLRKTASEASLSTILNSFLQSNSPQTSQADLAGQEAAPPATVATPISTSRDLLRDFSSSIFNTSSTNAMAQSQDSASLENLLRSFQPSVSSTGFDDLGVAAMTTEADAISHRGSKPAGAAVSWAMGDEDIHTHEMDELSDFDMSSHGGSSPYAAASPLGTAMVTSTTFPTSLSSECLALMEADLATLPPPPALSDTFMSPESYEALSTLGEQLAQEADASIHTDGTLRRTRSRRSAPDTQATLSMLSSPPLTMDDVFRPSTPPRTSIPPVSKESSATKARRRPTKREQNRQLRDLDARNHKLQQHLGQTQAAVSDTLGVLFKLWQSGKMAGL